MRKALCTGILVCWLLLLVGCGKAPETGDQAENLSPSVAREEGFDADQYRATGQVDLAFYAEQAGDAPQKPSFKVAAHRTTMLEQGIVSFREAHAVIYGREDELTEIFAGRGTFDKASQEAALAGGVRLESSGLEVSLEEITWDNAERMARSQKPAVIQQNGTRLQTSTFALLPEENVLNLTDVQGEVALTPTPGQSEALEPAKAPQFTALRIERAPVVRMAQNRVESITGGLKMVLAPADETEAPLSVAAQDALFAYPLGGGAMPERVELTGEAAVNGAPGSIRADVAVLDLQSKQFDFKGSVTGSTEQVPSFSAERLSYSPGQVTLTGGVAVDAEQGSVQANRAVLDYDTNTMTFTGGVRMEGEMGLLQAEEATLDEKASTVTFTANVRGRLADFENFQASRIVHHLDTGNAEIANLRMPNVRLGEGGGDGTFSFDRMEINRAPSVQVVSKRVQSIRGGVEFVLTSDGGEPMRISGDTADFSYAGQGTMPDTVSLNGNIRVTGPMGNVKANQAQMSMADKQFLFTGGVEGSAQELESFKADKLVYGGDGTVVLEGNTLVVHPEGTIMSERAELRQAEKRMTFEGAVHGDLPQIEGLVAERIVLHLDSGAVELFNYTIREFARAGDTGEKASLRLEDVRDWPALIAGLRAGSGQAETPQGRFLAQLPDEVAQGILRLPADRTPNQGTQERIVKELNTVLGSGGLHDDGVWPKQSLPDDARNVLARPAEERSSSEVILLNRRLLEAAFPRAIARFEPKTEETEASSE